MKTKFTNSIKKSSVISTILVASLLNVGSMKLMAGGPLKEAKEVCLVVEGKIKHKLDNANDKYKIELVSEGKGVDSAFVSNNAKFSFDLKPNKHYAIRMSHDGMVSKLVSIYTDIPSSYDELCLFSFETGMISEEEAKAFDREMLDFPIAQVEFNKKKEAFTYSGEYTRMIKEDLALSSKYITPVQGFFNKKKTQNKVIKTNSSVGELCHK